MATSTSYDVLYTAMTTRGLRDVRITDLTKSEPSDTTTQIEAVAIFQDLLRSVFDLLPTHETTDVQQHLHAVVGSSVIHRLGYISLMMPERLRPFRNDAHSLIQIAIRHHLARLNDAHSLIQIAIRHHLVRLVELGTRPGL